jgi:hypothetical protein
MSIGELGALGEFLGFFAVLATLIYLSVQTHQTKQVAIGQATRDVISGFQSLWSILGEDREKTRLIRVGANDWNQLRPNEQMIVHVFFVNLVVHFTGALEQEDRLPELKNFIRAWEDNVLGLLQCEGGRVWYESCEYVFLDTVRARIQARLSQPDELPPPWTESIPWWRIEPADVVARPA